MFKVSQFPLSTPNQDQEHDARENEGKQEKTAQCIGVDVNSYLQIHEED